MIRLSDENKFLLSALALVALLVTVSLAFGAVFGFCDNRKIQKQEANISNAAREVEQGEKQVEETKQDAAGTKGEVKILKEVVKENNEQVKTKTDERRAAALNRARVRRHRLRNVNGAELNRILDDAERQP